MEELKHILFIDIETVSVVADHSQMSPGLQKEWAKKAKFLKSSVTENADAALLFNEKAGRFSEFAKVSFHKHDGEWKMRLKARTGHSEKIC